MAVGRERAWLRAFRVAVPSDAKVKICAWITSAMVKGFAPGPRGKSGLLMRMKENRVLRSWGRAYPLVANS